tara:strand:+ start:32 stop:574 length:543 start_codon:yes stop_codon:yes gene_type:complete
MRKLHLGVVEAPYVEKRDPTEAKPPRKMRLNKDGSPRKVSAREYAASMKDALGEGSAPVETTGDVASILEAEYGVMQAFADSRLDWIADQVANSLAGAMETMEMGGPVVDPFATVASQVETGFKAFIASGEIEGLGIAGVPTKAAQLRKSSRFKKGVNPKGRPSFVDTGLYQASAKAWVE